MIEPKAGYLYSWEVNGKFQWSMIVPRNNYFLKMFFDRWEENSDEELYLFTPLNSVQLKDSIYHRGIDHIYGTKSEDGKDVSCYGESNHTIYPSYLLPVLYGWGD